MKDNIRGLVIDIDETISWTVGYWVKEMQKRFGNPEKLSVKDLIEKYKYTQNVPYWQNRKALEWIEKMRNNNKLQEGLPVIKNAASTLREINKIIPVVAYISTRPESVIRGTKKWLLRNKFPKADVVLRPNNVSTKNGNKWKAKILKSSYPKFVAIIDDNPTLIDFLPNYKGTIFLYGSTKYKSNKTKVIPCENWKDALLTIKKHFN